MGYWPGFGREPESKQTNTHQTAIRRKASYTPQTAVRADVDKTYPNMEPARGPQTLFLVSLGGQSNVAESNLWGHVWGFSSYWLEVARQILAG